MYRSSLENAHMVNILIIHGNIFVQKFDYISSISRLIKMEELDRQEHIENYEFRCNHELEQFNKILHVEKLYKRILTINYDELPSIKHEMKNLQPYQEHWGRIKRIEYYSIRQLHEYMKILYNTKTKEKAIRNKLTVYSESLFKKGLPHDIRILIISYLI